MSSRTRLTILTQSHIPLTVGGCASSAFFLGVSSLNFIFGATLRDVVFSPLDEGAAEEKMGFIKMVSDVVGCLLPLNQYNQ